MNYDFKPFKQSLEAVKEWLVKELNQIRTGRAAVAILDGVRVEAYGSPMPINQTASVSLEDPKTIRITPWDMGLAKAIEKGITDADLGLSVVTDQKGLRVIFPELTGERREIMAKQVGKKLEEAKISLRQEREKTWNDIQAKEKDGGMSEDDKFRYKDEMQKICDDVQKSFEDLAKAKEEEIKN